MTRARVDQFRRTVPLITDLKNKAMRLRHWDEIMVRYGLHDCSLTSTLCLGLVSLGFFFQHLAVIRLDEILKVWKSHRKRETFFYGFQQFAYKVLKSLDISMKLGETA